MHAALARPAHHHEHLWRGGLERTTTYKWSPPITVLLMKGQKELGRHDFSRSRTAWARHRNAVAFAIRGGVREGKISLNRFVEITSTAPAKIFGMYPKKGTLAVGSDADIVIFDPEREETISAFNSKTHHMNIDYSAYEGFKVKGYTETVLSRGKIVIDRGNYVGRAGDGAFLKRSAYGGHYANTHANMVKDVLAPRASLGSPGRRVS